MQIATVGVVGLGTMGAGIAEVFARAGLDVVAVEIDDALLDAGRRRVTTSLDRALDRGRLSADDHAATSGRLRWTSSRADVAAVDLVVEAIPERLELKTALFDELDRLCPPHTVFASNTSSLPVTAIAAATARPGRVVGMHFFNPAPVMRLVEIVHTVLTDPDAVTSVAELARYCAKSPVVVTDRAGFVANALLFGYLNDAARLAETGYASVASIDRAMTASYGFPMGPLTLMDLIGLDVCLEVCEVMYDETRDRRYSAAPLLRRLVMAGHMGRKSGRGYYDYSGGGAEPAVGVPDEPRPGDVSVDVAEGVAVHCKDRPGRLVERLLLPHLNDAVQMVDDGYATRDDVDTAMRLGCGYPDGPFALLDRIGPAVVEAGLRDLGVTPSPLLREL